MHIAFYNFLRILAAIESCHVVCKASKLQGDLWLINTRIQYGTHEHFLEQMQHLGLTSLLEDPPRLPHP